MKKRTKRIICLVMAVFIAAFNLLPFNGEPSFEVKAATTKGRDTIYRTQEEIRTYYENHPVQDFEAEFSVEPSITLPYSAGKLTDEVQQDALNMLNLYRYIAGLEPVTIGTEETEYAQAASLVMAVNRDLSHSPDQPAGMSDELFSKALYGSFNSNIAGSGQNIAGTIRRYMTEVNGDANFGHRRQLLDYYYTKTGFGAAKSSSGSWYSATFVDANLREDKVVAYPGENQPLEYFGPGYAWTVIVPQNVDKSTVKLTVTDTKTGDKWVFDDDKDNWRIDRDSSSRCCIIFAPREIYYNDGDSYRVDITGIPTPISYNVNLFYLGETEPVTGVTATTRAYAYADPDGKGTGDANPGTCEATVVPENASNINVIWTSEDPSIAVPVWNGSNSCKVRGIKEGETYFVATTQEGGFTARTKVVVWPRPTGIDLEDEYIVGVGQTIKIKAYALPEKSGDAHFSYTFDESIVSMKSDVLSIDGYASFTGLKVGETTIKAYASVDHDVTRTAKLKVVEPVFIDSITFEEDGSYLINDEAIQLNPIISPSNATVKSIKWSTSNTNTAKVDQNGLVKGERNTIGEVTITAEAQDGSGIKGTCKLIKVVKSNAPSAPTVDSVSATTIKLKSIYNGQYSLDGENWQDSPLFTGLTPETEYTLFARIKGSGNYSLPTDPSEGTTQKTTALVTSIEFPEEIYKIEMGDTLELDPIINPSTVLADNLEWESTSKYVASVTGGVVKGVSVGKATITASSMDDDTISASCSVWVIGQYNAPSAPEISSYSGTTVKLSYQYGCEYSYDKENWQSSNTFTDLTPNTEYTFYARRKADDTHHESEPSEGTTVTTKPIVTSISFPQSEYSIDVGETITLEPIIVPEGIDKNDLIWSMDKSSYYATFYKGELTGKASSTITVTAKSPDDDSIFAKCTVYVMETYAKPDAPELEAVTSNKVSIKRVYNNSYEYSYDKENWQTSNIFTDLTPDTEYTFYKRIAGNNTHHPSEPSDGLVVRTLKEVSSVSFSEEIYKLDVGDTITIEPVIEPSDYDKDNLRWTIGCSSSYADFSKGVVTGKKPTKALVTAYSPDDNSIYGECEVWVVGTYSKPDVPTLSSVSSKKVVLVDQSSYYSDGIKYQYSKDLETWQDSATFTDLTPDTEYTFYRRAKANDIHHESEPSDGLVVKTKKAAASISFPQEIYKIDVGEQITLDPVIEPSDVTMDMLNWTTSYIYYASVANGVVTGRSPAKVTITASDPDDSSVKASCEVWVIGKRETMAAPEERSHTSTSVYLVSTYNAEYSMDKENWQSSNAFTGLDPNTEYTFYQRYKGNDIYHPGDPSEGLTVKTSNAAASISFEQDIYRVNVNESIDLDPVITPSSITADMLRWTISNSSYATLSSGTVTGISPAKLTVRAYSPEDSSIFATCQVWVMGKRDQLSAPTVRYTSTTSVTLTAVYDAEYSKDMVNWQSSPTFNGLDPDTEYTFYQRMAGNDVYYPSDPSVGTTVRTEAEPVINREIIFGLNEYVLDVGDTEYLDPILSPDDFLVSELVWNSSDSEGLSVEDGTITANSCGTYTVTASYVEDSSVNASVTVRVMDTFDKPDKPVLLSKDDTSVTIQEESGLIYTCDGVYWQTSGEFTNLSPDTEYTFYAKRPAEGYYRESPLSDGLSVRTDASEVPPVNERTISFDETQYTMDVGEELTLSPNTSPEDFTEDQIIWSSSDDGLQVENGIVTASAAGLYTVTAADMTDDTVRATVSVKVMDYYTTPDRPRVQSVDKTSITLKTIDGCVYSKDNKNWQDSPVFTGLTPDTEYIFYAKRPASGYYYESKVSFGTAGRTLPDEEAEKWPFKDVNKGDALADEMLFAYNAGIIGGFTAPDENGQVIVKPLDYVKRSQFAIMLYNMAGRPRYVKTVHDFVDVPEGSSGYDAIMWAASNGVINGFDEYHFKPANKITRAQIAIMLKGYSDKCGYSDMYVVTDNDLTGYRDYSEIKQSSFDSLKWAVDQGILSGTPQGKLNPNSPAMRNQCSAFLVRFYKQFVE